MFILSGLIETQAIVELRRLFKLQRGSRDIVLDLKDVSLVSREVMSFLAGCEADGVKLENCTPYLREWMEREKIESGVDVAPTHLPSSKQKRGHVQMKNTSKAVEQNLAQFAIEAHGGLGRWNRFSTISAHLIQDGVFWGVKGKAGVLGDVTIKVGLRGEKVSHWPFGSPDRRSRFEPQRVALENGNGEVLEELLQPRSSFKGHTFETPWTDLQLAYFVGCAMWTYMNTPFFLARSGIQSEEIAPWQEAGETWRRLKVRFPAEIATHSTEQTLYFDREGLLKRHDYHMDISGDIGAAHYVSDIKEFSGIVFPTKHRIFGLQPDGHAAPEPLVVSINIDQLVLF